MKLKFIIFGILVIIYNSTKAQENLSVKVDQRMEALSIFYTLATVDTMDIKPTPSIYYKDFKTHFEPYKNHKSLNWYRNLESWDGYDIASLGLFLSENYPFEIKIKPEVNYIRSSDKDTFLFHFNEFYKDCKVKEFIEKHKKLYKSVCKTAKDSVKDSGILKEIQEFYRKPTASKFIIYVDLLNNMGNNAIPSNNIKFNGNRMFRLAYLNDVSKNLIDESPVFFTPYLNVVTHEISHLFVQDFLKDNKKDLSEIKNIFLTTSKGEKLNESEWENELDELIVRVCTAKILEQKFGKEKGLEEIENQSRRYKLAKPLYAFFENYSLNRNKYKSITDFYSKIMEYLKNYEE
ncbi:DUF4932 domain-containing protein [Polaribacter undariae]|uniref:DUF4932 domain-containing protein n=1 Tax=Polaribacter sejongensis TaxID=985043 RepID=A0AAJ1QVK7_9FLAO|nr:DUF4932 domain-containing protein [Polaribacter undariae]MDN3618770.1 DUF4932 domain-containing protein [Polaribacter undariae]UWD32861.1 DUF4932 domain-containing protein [Polaribacter undariae]